MKLEYSRQIFEKYSSDFMTIQWEPSSIRTDGHDEANNLISQLRERASKLTR